MKKKKGYYGEFGGSFVSRVMQEELDKIEEAYKKLKKDKGFINELKQIRRDFQGRPTPLYYCKNLTEQTNGAKIYLKREDLNHTGAHKINHCMGEMLLAKHLGKTKVIAETGAGQHGLAIATAAAYFGLECEIHMGEIDVLKQASNVAKMKLLGAKVISVTFGQKTLKEAIDSALGAYQYELENSIYSSIYCIGTAAGPHPFPMIVRDFQSIIGKEAKRQIKNQEKRLPKAIVACIGGGSNAIGLFSAFLKEDNVQIYGVEPLGRGTNIGDHAAALTYGKFGIIHGFKSLVLKNDNDEVISDAYSIASGLDYQSVGPEHAYLHTSNKVSYVTINDKEALEAFHLLSRVEGIIPALESAHAVAFGLKLAKKFSKAESIIINLSGRGDKDVEFVFAKSE
ncbi:MAG: tryptophan synthase subunit beta [Erysipelotrichales bacterium]|nr:tryptophan synthase subunit beta [Erysipelotrichales bacterium]